MPNLLSPLRPLYPPTNREPFLPLSSSKQSKHSIDELTVFNTKIVISAVDNGNSWRGGRGNQRSGYNKRKGRGRGNGQSSSRRSKPPYDPNKDCEKQDNRGHKTEECLTLKRESRQAVPGDQYANASNYLPSCKCPLINILQTRHA